MKYLLKIISYLIVSYVTVTLVLWLNQRALIFIPSRGAAATPAAFNVPYEEVWLPSFDGTKIHGWWIEQPAQKDSSPTVFYCHGNGGKLGELTHVTKIFYSYGWNAFLFDYRGYGESEDAPNGLSESALVGDAEAAFQWVSNRTSPKKLFVWGHSLGSSIAAHASMEKKIAGLVLEGTFPSMYEMSRYRYPLIPILPSMIWDRFETSEYLKHVDAPLLFLHAENDTVIPLSFGQRTYENAHDPKRWILIEGVGHNDFPSVEGKYSERIRETINGWMK